MDWSVKRLIVTLEEYLDKNLNLIEYLVLQNLKKLKKYRFLNLAKEKGV